jgi:hypothetical protein
LVREVFLQDLHWLAADETKQVFICVFTYLVEAYRPIAASGKYKDAISFLGVDLTLMCAPTAMAANSFMRSSFAAAFPLFSTQSYHRLGNGFDAGFPPSNMS